MAAGNSNSYGVSATLTPAQVAAGEGDSVEATVQVTNTGSTAEQYNLQVSGIAGHVPISFPNGSSNLEVPPGASNFRDFPIAFNLVAVGIGGQFPTPGTYPFTVTVTASDQSSSTTVDGTLTVNATGVGVELSPPNNPPLSGNQAYPGATLNMVVFNNGSATDTFKLSLAGPGALVASLGQTTVTLAAGASANIPVTTSSVNFADAGTLALTAIATSQTDSTTTASATDDLVIGTTTGLTASASPAVQACRCRERPRSWCWSTTPATCKTATRRPSPAPAAR